MQNKVYLFTISSLLSKRLILVFFITAGILISWNTSLQAALQTARYYGGLWLLLVFTVFAFAETFIRLIGHRLEIRDDILYFKTMFSNLWAIPVKSIQRIDPKSKYYEHKSWYFSLTTDNKEYTCGFDIKNYPELLSDLKSINPDLEIKISEVSPWDNPNKPLNRIMEQKYGTNGLFARMAVKFTSLSSGWLLFFGFLLVIAVVWLAVWMEDSHSLR